MFFPILVLLVPLAGLASEAKHFRFEANDRVIIMEVVSLSPFVGSRFSVYTEDQEICLGAEKGACAENFVGAAALVRFSVAVGRSKRQGTGRIRERVVLAERSAGFPDRPAFHKTVALVNGAASDLQLFGYDEGNIAPSERVTARAQARTLWGNFQQELYWNREDRPFAVIQWRHSIEGIRLIEIEEPSWQVKMEQASLWIEAGEYQKAESFLAKETADPSVRGLRLAAGLGVNATFQESMGRFAVAEKLYLKALDVLSRESGSDQIRVTVKNNLGELYRKMGQTARAEKTLREALSLAEASLGANHADLRVIQGNLGNIHFQRNEFAKAEAVFRKIVESVDREGQLDSGPGAAAMSSLAVVLSARGNHSEGLSWAERAVGVWEFVAPNAQALAEGLRNCGGILIKVKKYPQANVVLQRAAAIANHRLDEKHPLVSEIWRLQAEVLRKLGRGKEAKQLIGRANKNHEAHQRENLLGHQVDLSELRW
jgi:tetratricopeptide (TPR) repeat protein